MKLRWKVMMVSSALVWLGACGSSSDAGVKATGSDPGVPADVTVSVLHSGRGDDSEPDPRGTLRVGSGPGRYYWVQAISAETYGLFQSLPETDSSGLERQIPDGPTQTVVERDGAFRLIAAFAPDDPTEVRDLVWDLDSLPADTTFHPASPVESGGLTFDPEIDPPDLLGHGAYLIDISIEGTTRRAVVISSGSAGVVGLVQNPTEHSPGTYTGNLANDRRVAILADPDETFTVIVTEPPSEWLDIQTERILESVGNAI